MSSQRLRVPQRRVGTITKVGRQADVRHATAHACSSAFAAHTPPHTMSGAAQQQHISRRRHYFATMISASRTCAAYLRTATTFPHYTLRAARRSPHVEKKAVEESAAREQTICLAQKAMRIRRRRAHRLKFPVRHYHGRSRAKSGLASLAYNKCARN